MRINDYKMFTYVVTYTARAHVRDELGETTGQMTAQKVQVHFKVVARSRAVADAWVKERHNAGYQGHKDFTFHCTAVEEAPNLLIEYAG